MKFKILGIVMFSGFILSNAPAWVRADDFVQEETSVQVDNRDDCVEGPVGSVSESTCESDAQMNGRRGHVDGYICWECK